MTQPSLTPEQQLVVEHPLGQHARVLAVAGSGKSTTMAYRIKHLVQDCGVRPSTILVLMFNSLARKQFSTHLDRSGLPEALHPSVHTFHSFSFQVINQMTKYGFLPANTQYWLADKSELIWLTVKRAISNLERSEVIPVEAVDPEEALSAINLWKGSLIPPERAGSTSSPYLPLVYQEFEALRLSENALTFDDFVPSAIQLMESHPLIRSRYCQDIQHLIVDEYQDINYGQQRLIELLAGKQADVMVVGDDDQTIYEWRGARPNYILHDFAQVFSDKPVKDYRLSRSFRFGPLIAQCAANVIACNTTRLEKPLIAFQPARQGFVHVFQSETLATKELTEQILALTQVDGVSPSEIIVLARLFAQLDNLETEFLSRRIPYRVDGQEPFFKRQEIKALLDYLRLGLEIDQPIHEQSASWLQNVANKPSRMLSRSLLSRIASSARYRRQSIRQALENAPDDRSIGMNGWQVERLTDLSIFLELLADQLANPAMLAGGLLEWMVQVLDYLAYFQDYYGKGEHADEKKYAVLNFIRYVTQLNVTPQRLLDHLAQLDTTQGQPDDALIVFTTIFRTKGLEFDYVVLPQCDDNLLPYLKGERTDIFDTAGLVSQAAMSSKLESERRLFYVALTRARKGVLIGTSENPSRFLSEVRLSETEPVMDTIAHLASGDQQAVLSLQNSLRRKVHTPSLRVNLLGGYLPDLGMQSLARELEQQATSVHA